jgi:pimeloyl-ACP methyl ester carboxylesterase
VGFAPQLSSAIRAAVRAPDHSNRWESQLTTTHVRRLFLLHSLGLDADSWTPMIEAAHSLMPAIDLVPVDLIGHGSASDTAFVAADAALEVIRTARGYGAEQGLHLVGSGLGALVALHITDRSPSNVASLVLAGWPPPAPSPGESRANLVAAALETNGAKLFAADYLEGLGTIRDGRDRLTDAIVVSSTRGLIPAIRAAEAWRVPTTAVPAFPPCLIVRGALDVRVSEQAARQFADVLGAEFVNIADAGHLAYIDRPRSFASAVADFHTGLV